MSEFLFYLDTSMAVPCFLGLLLILISWVEA